MFSRLPSLARPSCSRLFATRSQTLFETMQQVIPQEQTLVKNLRETKGDKVLGTCTVSQAYGGMRSVKSLVTETSLLDAEEGIRIRGYSVPEFCKELPKAKGGEQPLPEGIYWLLLTSQIPSQEQVQQLSAELNSRAKVPAHVLDLIARFPKNMHPMTQFSAAVLALQTESKFAAAYQKGVNKSEYWKYAFEDSLDLIARIPQVCAHIYRHLYRKGELIAPDTSLDWGSNFAHMLGYKDKNFHECLRLYLCIHSDHEGGNVSAHATHLIGSALSDPYLSFSGGLNGLAGPLHGLANQEVLRWIMSLKQKLGDVEPTKEIIEKELWATLNSGQVVPGFGHAVLRKTDPRYSAQREFSLKYLPNDPLFKLVSLIYEVAPRVLTEHGKTKNPWPNVDAHSGVLLHHYGMTEDNYYTVLFGASRALGVLASLVWDRALGLPIERPKSVTTQWIIKEMAKQA